jgi:predicted  nucleic acid-binding Zn-ribbon protein
MTMSQGERLMRIETLLESLPEIKEDIKAIRKELDEDKADLAALKNKGTGLLIGVGLVGGGIGAALTKALTAWLT